VPGIFFISSHPSGCFIIPPAIVKTISGSPFIDSIDLDLLISHIIKKDRAFILAYPDHPLSKIQYEKITALINRRLKKEPLAYILGEKEFYSLNFKVNKHTLIPRPETELMVEMALQNITSNQSSVISIVDVGTGSGNIIISIANQLKITDYELLVTSYFGIDISKEALKIAKQNAKLHKVDKNIKFLQGIFLSPFLKSKILNHKSSLLILGNLPYLSKEIYNSCPPNVKKYEPKTALYSANYGLAHYAKLFSQIKLLVTNYELPVTILIEISPEQKKLIIPLVRKYFSQAKIEFKKDLAKKWRVAKIEL